MLTTSLVQDLIRRSRPARIWTQPGKLAFLGLIAAMGFLILSRQSIQEGDGVGSLLPWIFLLTVLAYSWWTATRQRQENRLLRQLREAMQWENWDVCEKVLGSLLKRPMRDAMGRVQALLSLGSLAQVQKQFEAAEAAYRSILEEEPPSEVPVHAAELGLAAVQLRTEQLSYAVDRIQRLERQDLPESMRADVELVSLYREVLMGHSDSAAQSADRRRALFRRHLSTRAAFGYGLLAAAMDVVGRTEEARGYWEDATLLMDPDKLVERMELLSPVAARFPAATSPL